jgi:hypothetical protein
MVAAAALTSAGVIGRSLRSTAAFCFPHGGFSEAFGITIASFIAGWHGLDSSVSEVGCTGPEIESFSRKLRAIGSNGE